MLHLTGESTFRRSPGLQGHLQGWPLHSASRGHCSIYVNSIEKREQLCKPLICHLLASMVLKAWGRHCHSLELCSPQGSKLLSRV